MEPLQVPVGDRVGNLVSLHVATTADHQRHVTACKNLIPIRLAEIEKQLLQLETEQAPVRADRIDQIGEGVWRDAPSLRLQTILDKALAAREVWSAKALARELTNRGLSITEGPLALHRTKSCGCYR